MKNWCYFARSIGLCLTCIVMMSPGVSVSAGDLYRYRNDQGNQVINHTVPPQLVKNGYERLDSNGRLLERVAAVTDKPETEEVTLSPKALLAQERQDKYLLTSFSSVDDISAAEKRKLSQISGEIEVLRSNAKKIKELQSGIEQDAAQFQRSGKEVSKGVMSRLANAEEQITKNAERLSAREAEHAETRVMYGKYADRFRELKGLPPSAAPVADKTNPETPTATELSSSQLASD